MCIRMALYYSITYVSRTITQHTHTHTHKYTHVQYMYVYMNILNRNFKSQYRSIRKSNMADNKYDSNISLDFMSSFYGSSQLEAVCSICNEIPNYPIRNHPQGNSGADIHKTMLIAVGTR